TWAMASGGTIIPLTNTSYGIDIFTSGTNTDVINPVAQTTVTTNSLRFNAGSPVLTLNGSLTLQSGGILVTASNVGGSIAGSGALTAGGAGELIVHQYGSSFPIN